MAFATERIHRGELAAGAGLGDAEGSFAYANPAPLIFLVWYLGGDHQVGAEAQFVQVFASDLVQVLQRCRADHQQRKAVGETHLFAG